jgi:hypothetical protein
MDNFQNCDSYIRDESLIQQPFRPILLSDVAESVTLQWQRHKYSQISTLNRAY